MAYFMFMLQKCNSLKKYAAAKHLIRLNHAHNFLNGGFGLIFASLLVHMQACSLPKKVLKN